MTKCEFCHRLFTPRPQTKKPRACKKRECQKKRQKANEKACRNKDKGRYDKKYHAVQKLKRFGELRERAKQLVAALKVGCRFLGQAFEMDILESFVWPFVVRLGIRRVNKLWSL